MEKIATVTIKHKKGTEPMKDGKLKAAIKTAVAEALGEGHVVKVDVAATEAAE